MTLDLDAVFTRRTLLRTGAAGVGAATLGGLLSGCGQRANTSGAGGEVAPRRGGSVKMVFSDAYSGDTPDPGTAGTILSLTFSGMVYDGLVRVDNNWKLTPGLASEYSANKDFTSYTFNLRRGVEFHSGQTLTSKDVVFTFQRMYDEKLGNLGLVIFSPVLDLDGVKAVDATTVRFDLKTPDVDFLIKLAHWYGKIVADGTTNISTGSHGTGPFMNRSFTGGEGFVVERNPNYWESGMPYLDRVEGVVITDAATHSEAVVSGDADISDPPAFSALAQIKGSSVAKLVESPFGSPVDFGIDGSTAPFDNPDVRRASKLAVDREKMVSIVTLGHAIATPDSIVNPKEAYWPGGVEATPYDPEQARFLIKKSDLGGKLTIWTPVGVRPFPDTSTLLAEEWNAVGLSCEVNVVSVDELFSRYYHKAKVVANYWLRQHYSTFFPDTYLSTGPDNESRLKDPELDRLIGQLQRTPLDRGGENILREILVRYNNEAATIFPYHMTDVWAVKNRVHGMEIVPTEQVEMRRTFVA